MCQDGSAIEQLGADKEGNLNFDHVTLRVRTQKDNCTCLVFVENQSLPSIQMYIQPYLHIPNSAPKEEVCGLELYLDLYQIDKKQHDLPPIKCSSGQLSRSISLLKNSVLRFTSRIVDGNFTRGYCIDVQRVHTSGQNGSLKMACNVPGVTPTWEMTTLLPDVLTSQSTSADASVNDYSTSSDQSPVYIASGASIFRKSSDKIKKSQEARRQETNFSNEQDDPDYDGLKYNMLYVSSEHQDVMEGDYHIVDNEEPLIISRTKKHDMNYSTVDDNGAPSKTIPYQGIALNFHTVQGYDKNKSEDNAKVNNPIPSVGNSNVYAVVDKKKR
ncbi:unnamed protein product [Mytilus coruscus]|uniref:Uncharacterized protein n=1 Tax=Mytilus coruscus TaxID=42192 RepID=A0A6J8EC64_MYTCO|nr:unnamed protein product [Mytilus coruscus]